MGKKRSSVTVHARKDQGGRILKKSRLEAAAQAHAGRALSKASETAYEALWSGFEAWCYDFGEQALPASPTTVAQYLTDQAATDHKAATLDSILAAIQHHHRVAGLSSPHDHPDVRAVRSGIRRELGTAQRRVEPMLVDILERVVTALPNTLAGARDRALLLFGFASALRRSELVALEVADLRRTAEGYQAARIRSGGIFRGVDKHGHVDPRPLSGRSVALIVKRAVEAVGLPPEDFAGHSLRAGFVSQAALMGADFHAIRRQTGHRSPAIVDRYVRLAVGTSGLKIL